MPFRIHTDSPELQRELESKLAALQGQLDENLEYEITVEVLPREQALESVEEAAKQVGAETIFVAAGTVGAEARPIIDSQQSPVEAAENNTAEDLSTSLSAGSPSQTDECTAQTDGNSFLPSSVRLNRAPRNTEKLKEAAAVTAAQARESLQRAGIQARSMLSRAGMWTAQKAGEAQASTAEARLRLRAKSEQWKNSAAEWNAQRVQRKEAEIRLRQERQRAAHREAELAAISAQIMLERQKSDDKPSRAQEAQKKPEPKPMIRPATNRLQKEERDMSPVWRNAFVAAACIALVGIFLLASGGKQTSAAPATSTELSQPSVVVPAHAAEHPKPQPIAPAASAQVPQPATKPSAHKRVARARDEDEDFQEVTVRDYRIAPPKKDAKGVVQISDME
jgi:hypothetical protein